MLSYLHGFHAGNAADVLKHSTLIFCLEYLKKKEKPLLCVDTHAGAGLYDFSGAAAAPNREWEKGIGRLPGFPPAGAAGEAPPMIASYIRTAAGDFYSPPRRYSGSPLIMAKLLKRGDRLVCFELHPREVESLKGAMAAFRDKEKGPLIEVRREDGPGGLKSLLPPPSRRGLILIDPSWEEQSEYSGIPRAVSEGLKRFPEGTFIVWYPLLSIAREKAAVPLSDTLFAPGEGKRCRAELYTGPVKSGPGTGSPRSMYGSGLVIHNPPWTLRAALEETLPYLAETLGEGGGWRLDWEE